MILVLPSVRVFAVVRQQYELQVYDEYVISGNTAVLRCQVPSYVADYVMVTSWLQDGVVNIYPNTDTGGKYAVLGDLYIYNAGPSDAYKSYACRTVHRLTGEVQSSPYPGRIVISEPKGEVAPRISVEKHSSKHVKVGDDVTLACVAQGYPVPSYRWVICRIVSYSAQKCFLDTVQVHFCLQMSSRVSRKLAELCSWN